MEEKQLRKLKNEYGFAPGSYKYILPGSEIMRYIDQIMILIEYRKKEGEEDAWTNEMKKVKIISISDHNPENMTYLCKYQIEGEEEVKEERIIPEGYSWGIPEESGYMLRFMPYSTHCQAVEDEFLLQRVKDLYDKRETLDFEILKALSKDPGQAQVLKYSHNIGMAVKLADGDFLWIRIHSLKLKHRQGKVYGLFLADAKNTWPFVISPDDKEYNFMDSGTFKILDLADE